jgi:tetratricopeptide (TPR) repeat protein
MRGKCRLALNLYQHSIELHPTAEAYTFLGWTYSFLGRMQEAIRACVKAISVDPDFGNAYNDIGAYLIELGREDDAIFWLQRATRATRYECYHFPWFNLGRVYEAKGEFDEAKTCYRKSLELCPEYTVARRALLRLLSCKN